MAANEASPFESSEMLATLVASTPLLRESWRLCSQANATAYPRFVSEVIGGVVYVAFSGVQMVCGGWDPNWRNLVALDSIGDVPLFSSSRRDKEGEEPIMVHAGMLNLFSSFFNSFQNQMLAIVGNKDTKSVVITGHSIGGATASLCALWLLSYLQSTSSTVSVLCITFGSPLLGNKSFSCAILKERWGGNFCHVVSKHDIMPRLLFAPLTPLTAQLNFLLQYWHLSMTSPDFGKFAIQISDKEKAQLFTAVMDYLEAATQDGEASVPILFHPFGNYFFVSEEGAVCVDSPATIIKMMHLMLATSSPTCSIEDHLKYGDYVNKVSMQFLLQRNSMQRKIPDSSYEAGFELAIQSSGIANQESTIMAAKECLKTARRMGPSPNLNAATLAVTLSKFVPYRAQIEWYKTWCDEQDEQTGYYDSFKSRGSSKREMKVNINRVKLAKFWDNVIDMLERNELPHDFNKRAKWVNASQFYKLLVEPLDIAPFSIYFISFYYSSPFQSFIPCSRILSLNLCYPFSSSDFLQEKIPFLLKMDVKSRGIALNTMLHFLVFSSIFPLSFSAANQSRNPKKPPTSDNRFGSSAVFQVQGNVYPLGYYTVSLNIGYPPKLYDLDIDSGSDLTWVQCDAPCRGCTKPSDQLYKPNNNLVQCLDQLCAEVQLTTDHHCAAPDDQCDYEVEYADQGSSLGVLVQDYVPLRFTNGSVVRPRIAFGCGYDQKYSGPTSLPSTAGVLGLGSGRASMLSQLHSLGLIRNVVGHCLSGRGGGFLFFGDGLIPSSGIVWTPMLPGSSGKHYSTGPAELFFNGKPTAVKGLELIFDSGSSYTYFNSQAYRAIVDLVANDLKGKQLKRATDDPSLPICWKGAKSFKSLSDVKSYFKPLALSFTKTKNSQMQLPPEAYLIITKYGNVCLGILNGSEVGLGNLNIIGDISLQDKMVVYDNEKQQIGWVSANCDRLPNVDRDFEDGFPHTYAANLGILKDQCSAKL